MSETTKPLSGTPRFSLAILFLWVTLVSVSVGAWLMLLQGFFEDDFTGLLDWFSMLFYGTSAIVLGTGVTVAALIGFWFYRGHCWAWQPGHILPPAMSFYELVTMLAVAVDLVMFDEEVGYSSFRQSIYAYEGLVQYTGITLMLSAYLCLIRTTRFWQFVFGMLIFENLLILCMINPFELAMGQVISFETLRWSSVVTRIIIFVLMLLLTVWELIQREWRDWLHWVGLAVALIYFFVRTNILAWS
ncbi:hypothetical protein [Bremerella sp. P1]|uniref:hypothetical protein n=1 Tax=Bremerella sp. P1 TaxID=3026424 RepID=UPI0023675847|nr:hypothetical protein [Bremerella sp. P1]WDI40033.1 hypothetical protein PSR63_16230 [Bremerella sp. P1]